MNRIVSFHVAFDFSYVYKQFDSLMIWSFLHKVCGCVVQVILLYLNLYHAIFLDHLYQVVEGDTHSDSNVLYCLGLVSKL